MDEARAGALLDAALELSGSLRVSDVGARLVAAALRVGLASGALLELDSFGESAACEKSAGATHGEPAAVFELRTSGASLGRLSVFATAPLDDDSLRALVAHGSLALANARSHEQALIRAERDALTGLSNYGRLTAELELELEHAQRYGRPLAFVMVDIDDFGGWNDRFGHAAGNDALVRVARLLRERLRASDIAGHIAGRYGGDELALVLRETTAAGAVVVAEKIRAAAERLVLGEAGATLTISAGISSAPGDGKTSAELIRGADARLYLAKAAGGNRVVA